MNQERLGRAAQKLDKSSRRNRRDLDRQARQETRVESRLKPFETLRNRNRSVFDRATRLVEAATDSQPPLGGKHRVCVVLGEMPTAPSTTLISQLTITNYESGGDTQRYAKFEFYKAKRNQFAQEVGTHPTSYALHAEIAVSTEKLRNEDERTFYVCDDGHDEVTKLALGVITGSAWKGKGGNQYSRIDKHLDAVELTIDMLEEAAQDEIRNPVLAQRLAISSNVS